MKIIIVDDDCLVAGALKTILEVNEDVEVLATGADGKEACELYERYEPDVLLMDIRMEKNGRSGSIPSILSRHPKANILLLTTFSDDEYIVKALRLGAKGYLLKQDYGSILPALLGGLLWADSIWDRNSFQDSRSFGREKRSLIMENMTLTRENLR